MSAQSQALLIDGPAGRLELLVEHPEQPVRGIAILCHPHPLHGGALTNKVVHTLASSLRDMGRVSIRFNFRGVGKSEGAYADGMGEQQDLQAVIDWAQAQFPGQAIWLGGFSFGAYIALAVQDSPVERLITVAPPVNFFDFSVIEQPAYPWLLIQGEADELVPADQVRRWLDTAGLSPDMVFLPEVEHFFHGKLNLLKQALRENLPSE